MATLLLKTKLYTPSPLNNLVTRRDQFSRLEAGLSGRLTLVAAPAGFGKTTLISSWVHSLQQPVAWVSLDEADNDPTLFWSYVISGFQSAHTGDDKRLWEQLNIIQLPPIKILLTQLINTVAENDQKIILVLDDYHLISNPQIHKDLTYLIENQPPSIHIIILTRADPPLPIPRLRGRGLLTEIRATDLRFTIEETELFLNERMRLGLNDDELSVLDQRTEGWIIGLQLAAISMQGRSDKHNFIADFSGGHHFILEYLTEEVIDTLPKSLRLFLLQTSVLDQFNASQCDFVIEIENSAAKLDEIQRHHLFIIPLDDQRIWFRYHHLFRDLLKNRLVSEFSAEHYLDLYRRASQWYQQNNDRIEAIKYALLGKDFEVAADMIEHTASRTMMYGHLVTLLNWIDILPVSVIESRPRLNFYRAWALSLTGKPKIAEQILMDIKSNLEARPETPENRSLRGELAALLTGIIVYTNDPPRVLREAQEALAYISDDNLISHARIHIAMGTAYAYLDEIEEAIQNYETARGLALKAKNPFLASAAIEMLTGMQIFHLGALQDAAENLEQALALGRKMDGTHQAFTGTAHILLAELHIEKNQLDLAKNCLENGARLIAQGGIGYSQTYIYCTEARLHLAQGESQKAVESLEQAKLATMDCPLTHIMIHNLACQVKFALCLGDIETATKWITTESGTTMVLQDNLPTYLREVQQISLARIYLAQDNVSESLNILEQIYPQAEAAGRKTHIIEILLLRAILHQRQGKRAFAIESLKRSISYAATEGHTRIFLEGGKPVWELLQLTAYQDFNPKFVNHLLAAFEGQTSEPKPFVQTIVSPQGLSALVEPLSERECEVLKLIAAGYTNREIADALVVSLNTIKKHTTHIYGKMGVRSRTEATARARMLGLLDSKG